MSLIAGFSVASTTRRLGLSQLSGRSCSLPFQVSDLSVECLPIGGVAYGGRQTFESPDPAWICLDEAGPFGFGQVRPPERSFPGTHVRRNTGSRCEPYRIDELGADLNAMEAYAVKAFPEQCRARVATHMGLSPAQLDRRGDIDVASGALSLSRWPTEPDARLVQCLAVTRQATVGTLEGLGDKPLPSGTLSTTPAPGAGSPTGRSGSNLEEAEAAERRAICQRYGSNPQKPAYC